MVAILFSFQYVKLQGFASVARVCTVASVGSKQCYNYVSVFQGVSGSTENGLLARLSDVTSISMCCDHHSM